MPLTADEQASLEALLKKKDEPEAPARNGPNVEVYIDLSDENAVERALGFGLLTKADLDDPRNPPPPDDEKPADDKPADRPKPRRGYFKDPEPDQ